MLDSVSSDVWYDLCRVVFGGFICVYEVHVYSREVKLGWDKLEGITQALVCLGECCCLRD